MATHATSWRHVAIHTSWCGVAIHAMEHYSAMKRAQAWAQGAPGNTLLNESEPVTNGHVLCDPCTGTVRTGKSRSRSGCRGLGRGMGATLTGMGSPLGLVKMFWTDVTVSQFVNVLNVIDV